MINKLQPDIIFFAGDLVDHNPIPVIKKKMGEHFKQLKPELGMYAVAGNHEFIGHANVSIDYLSQFGINYVQDTAIIIGGILTLAGRDDRGVGYKRGVIAAARLVLGRIVGRPPYAISTSTCQCNSCFGSG